MAGFSSFGAIAKSIANNVNTAARNTVTIVRSSPQQAAQSHNLYVAPQP